MLNEIEENSLARITSRLDGIRKASTKKGGELFTAPSVDAACLEGSFERVAAGTWKQTVTLSILVTFASIKAEEKRRKGINLLVEALFGMMIEQRLGLEIKPLHPLRWREVTDEDDYEEGKIKYLLQFSTSFTIEKLDEEESEDLLGIAVQYLLMPGDDQVDAEDETTLEGAQ